MVPRAVLMKSSLVSINTARQVNVAYTKTTVNATRPMSYLSKKAHLTVKRPIHKNTTFKNNNFNQRVIVVKDKNVNTVRPKVVVNVIKGNNVNVVKALAWQSTNGFIGSRHMTRNMSYLTDYEEIDGGYVTFGGNPKGGKITSKGTQSNGFANTKASDNAGQARKETEPVKNYILLPLWHMDLQDQGVIDSECSRHMTGNMSYLTNYEEIDGGYVAFEGNPKRGKIIRKGTQSNGFANTKASDNASQTRKETEPVKNYILLPLWPPDPPYYQDPKSSQDDGSKPSSDDGRKVNEDSRKELRELSDLVRKRIERSGELKNRKRVEYIKNRQSVWNGIRVNTVDSKLMLLGIKLTTAELLLLVKVNAARHKLTTAGES
ncbi:hypothetical protein Tco_1423407 [Tanacetum coccineum]